MLEDTDSDDELERCTLNILPAIPVQRARLPNRAMATRSARPPADDQEDIVLVREERGEAIDLTEGGDEEFVDLTASQSGSHGVNDAEIIVLGSTSDSPPSHRTRSRQSFQSTDSDVMIMTTPERPGPSGEGSSSEDPFSPRGNLKSPEPISLSCPVCLDDDKQIRLRKEKIVFTKCGHMFCRPCAHNTIRVNGNCALCRKKLRISDVFVLHV